eukprot:131752_1
MLQFLLYLLIVIICVESKLPYCKPSDTTCWPTVSDITSFSNQLDGTLVLQNMSNTQYITLATNVQNNNRITYPSFIILIRSHSDVEQCVQFTSSHNIQITIRSTGHSYSGRASANNSLQINLSNMQTYSFNKTSIPPTITIETGMRIGQAFGLVNATLPDYVLIGAGDNSVGPGGHSSLGGHSPLTPAYGLASDFIKEFYIVNANGNILHVYNTSGTNESIDNLYWAMKGGGASTFGVILNITFKLNKVEKQSPDDVYTNLVCFYSMYNKPFTKQEYIGNDILYAYFDYIPKLDPKVSGYFEVFYDIEITTFVFAFMFNYFGNNSFAKEMFEPLMHLNPYQDPGTCSINQYKHFWDSQVNDVGDTNDGFAYLLNDFIPQSSLTHEYADSLLEFLNATNPLNDPYYVGGGAATLIGGENNLNKYPDSAVGPGFRNGYWSFSLGVGWSNNSVENNNNAIAFGKKWESKFRTYGSGVYSNEENYDCDGCDWKQEFWGENNYNRLVKVKQQFDPNQVFWCNHCVGSDLN